MPDSDTTIIGEIRFWANTWGMPDGWLPCNGGEYDVEDYSALYSVIGTYYGGNWQAGKFNVPNLCGRAMVGMGVDQDKNNYFIGATLGQDTVAIGIDQMPSHQHTLNLEPDVKVNIVASTGTATDNTPGAGRSLAAGTVKAGFSTTPSKHFVPSAQAGQTVPLNGLEATPKYASITETGGGVPRENRQPQMTMGFFIAADGVYPTRS